ncbi:S41 family peptidase [Rickettsiales bacterium]|nr:S41 family peptidase [Rickettsiales bacterium]
MKSFKIFTIVLVATFIGFLSAMSLSQIKIKKLEVNEDISILDKQDTKNNIYYKNGKFLSEILYRIKNDYVDEKTDKELHQAAAKGLLSSLDPHSGYLNIDDLKEMQTQTKGEFGGLGIEITTEMQAVKVIAAIDDTPAQKAGLKSGDFIIKVDGENIVGLPISESVKKLRGKPGSKVKITLLRKTQKEPLIKEIVREIIKVKAVKSKIFNDVMYLKINTFSQQASSGLLKEVKKMKKEIAKNNKKVRGLVLDLRNNPGGLLSEAVKVSDAFLDDKKLIVSIKGRNQDSKQEYFDKANQSLVKNLPIAVIINEGSASASEIVAGALKDHNRAVIMGVKSFGKGSVQTIVPLKDGELGALRLTTSLYYTPSGVSIQAKGIEPDIEVKTAKLEILENNSISSGESDLRGHIENNIQKALKDSKDKNLTEENIKIYNEDYQLARAIDLIRGLSVYNDISKKESTK